LKIAKVSQTQILAKEGRSLKFYRDVKAAV
jgi:Ran GTPase-activating protein (RanGAP) involved in mRNA processing and transport